jgi:hypothetical protein
MSKNNILLSHIGSRHSIKDLEYQTPFILNFSVYLSRCYFVHLWSMCLFTSSIPDLPNAEESDIVSLIQTYSLLRTTYFPIFNESLRK